MIRTCLAACGLALLLVVVSFTTAADPAAPDEPEPPIRLKKKRPNPAPEDKPLPELKKPEEKPDPDKPEPDAPEPEGDEKEILERIAKNMQQSEKRLAAKDPGDNTRQVQKEIVKDLDALIQASRQQQQSSSSSSESQPQSNQKQQSKAQQQLARDRRNQQNRSQQQKMNQTAQNQKSGQEQKPEEKEGKGKQGGQGNSAASADENKLADVYKDIWGHLPETMRQEMLMYYRQGHMAKYKELVERYYATIAEKGRKGE